MKKLLVLLMVLLSICSSVFAESFEDVLKDCKLDRSRWKVVEWFKAEQFVRFYDSQAVAITGPGQFDLVLYDYYYGNTCSKSSCKLAGKKHYHSEKWGFNTKASKGTLRSFATKDTDESVVDSYDYPANLQIPTEIKRSSIEGKTMLKAQESVKNNKEFAAKDPEAKVEPMKKNVTGFAPLPYPIGTVEGEWTYLGRFIGPNNLSYVENIMLMKPFNSNVECDGVFDVYYFHKHGSAGNEDGHGCRVDQMHTHFYYNCILKFVPLDRNGKRMQYQGTYTELVSMSHASKGTCVCSVNRVRRFDNFTHKLVATRYTEHDYSTHNEVEQETGNMSVNRRLNPIDKNGKTDYNKMGFFYVDIHDSPYEHAIKHSNCPQNFVMM